MKINSKCSDLTSREYICKGIREEQNMNDVLGLIFLQAPVIYDDAWISINKK